MIPPSVVTFKAHHSAIFSDIMKLEIRENAANTCVSILINKSSFNCYIHYSWDGWPLLFSLPVNFTIFFYSVHLLAEILLNVPARGARRFRPARAARRAHGARARAARRSQKDRQKRSQADQPQGVGSEAEVRG